MSQREDEGEDQEVVHLARQDVKQLEIVSGQNLYSLYQCRDVELSIVA